MVYTLQLSSTNIPNYRLHVTRDGLLDVANGYAGSPLPYFVSVANEYTNIVHSASGYLTNVELQCSCVYLNEGLTYTMERLPVSNACGELTGNFIQGNITVRPDILSGIYIKPTISSCDCVVENRMDDYYPTVAHNTFIHVSGVFNVGGSVRTLTGNSNTFDVFPAQDFYNIRKRGEISTIKSRLYKMTRDHGLQNNVDYWHLVDGMFGTGVTDYNTSINERVANFAENEFFSDTFDYKRIADYRALFEKDVVRLRDIELDARYRRYFNLSTISEDRLFGVRCGCNTNFDMGEGCRNCKRCGSVMRVNNLGDILTDSSIISAGMSLVQYDKGEYTIVYTTPIDSITSYTVEKYKEYADIRGCLYEWNTTPQNNIHGNYLLMDENTRLREGDRGYFTEIIRENMGRELTKDLTTTINDV
jgi:hypothetical protein